MSTLTLHSKLKIGSFKTENEKDGQYFVQTHTNTVYKFTSEQYRFLKLLTQNHTVGNSARLANLHPTDAILLVGGLYKAGFIYEAQGHRGAKAQVVDFKKIGLYTIFIWIIIFVLTTIVTHFGNWRSLYPTRQDFFFAPWLSVSLLSSLLSGYLFAFGHELAHAVIAKLQGAKHITFRLSHRLHFLVFETVISDIYMLKEKHRYAIYLAGIGFDLLVLSFLWWLQIAHSTALITFSPLSLGFIRQMALIELLGLLWESMVFLKTDLYYLAIDLLDIEDAQIDWHNKRMLLVFSTMVMGNLAALWHLFAVIIPNKINIFVQGIPKIWSGNLAVQLDGGLAIFLETWTIVLLAWAIYHKSTSCNFGTSRYIGNQDGKQW